MAEDESALRYSTTARRLEFHSEYVNHGTGTYNLETADETYYDAWGNPTTMNRYQDWGGGSWSWNLWEGRTFSLSDRLLTRVPGSSPMTSYSVTYDARGRVTDDADLSYTWDVHDRLTNVTRASSSESWDFGYDASGRLVTMQEGAQTVRLKWRGSRLRGERIEESGESAIERVYRADGIDQGGTHLAMIRDVRGSVMGLAAAGARVRTYRYGVWGDQTVEAPDSTWAAYDTHMGFTGHVVHRPTGLVFAPARVYAPRLRQWLTRDPAGERDSVDGRNLYAYVAGDPVNRVDPTGLFWEEFSRHAYREGVREPVSYLESRVARLVDYFGHPFDMAMADQITTSMLETDGVWGDARAAASELYAYRRRLPSPASERLELVGADRYLNEAADGSFLKALIANLAGDAEKLLLPRAYWLSMDERRPSLPNFWVTFYALMGSQDSFGFATQSTCRHSWGGWRRK